MTLFALHIAPSLLAVGFAVLLVAALVAAEEVDLRRQVKPSKD